MNINEIEKFLAAETGLAPESIGRKSIETAVSRAARFFELSDIEFSNLLSLKGKELEKLIEEITIPETWFLRDRYPFEYLKKFIIKKHLLNSSKIRALSAPCSSGEEAYSIAISLFEAGMPAKHFSIDAIDINKNNILKAKSGLFNRVSFRPFDESFINKYFSEENGAYLIDEKLIKQINFFQANILKAEYLMQESVYDIIFCKNLLIYLNTEARATVINKLRELLKPEGLIFTGHTETPIFTANGFTSAKEPRTFAVTLSMSNSAPSTSILTSSKISETVSKKFFIESKEFSTTLKEFSTTSRKQKLALNQPKLPKIIEKPSFTKSKNSKNDDSLDSIQFLADSGRYSDAKKVCESYIKENPADANVYFLMGLLCNATNDTNAATANFEKTLYLEPEHYGALVNLSLIFAKTENYEKELIFKERARKSFEKNLKKVLDISEK